MTERIDRLLMFSEQHEQCYYCGCQMTVDTAKSDRPNYATFDHLVARKHKSGLAEVVLSCRSCNQLKGTMDAKQFKELMEQHRGEDIAAVFRQFWADRKQCRRSSRKSAS